MCFLLLTYVFLFFRFLAELFEQKFIVEWEIFAFGHGQDGRWARSGGVNGSFDIDRRISETRFKSNDSVQAENYYDEWVDFWLID